MGDESRIGGGNKRKIQKRRAPRCAFNAARRQVFLDHLASCANITHSAAGVGVSGGRKESSARAGRRRRGRPVSRRMGQKGQSRLRSGRQSLLQQGDRRPLP